MNPDEQKKVKRSIILPGCETMTINYSSISCCLCDKPLITKLPNDAYNYPELYCEKCVEIIDLLNAFLNNQDGYDKLTDRCFPGLKNYLFNPDNLHYSIAGISINDWKSYITNPNISLMSRRADMTGQTIEMSFDFIAFETKSATIDYAEETYIIPYKYFHFTDLLGFSTLGERPVLILADPLSEILNNYRK